MADLSSTLASFYTGTYTVTRPSLRTYTDGRLDLETFATFTTQAVVQPAPARELERLPEGLRTRETVAVWSPVELASQKDSQGADRLEIGGEDFEVQWVEKWDTLGAFWKVLATKVQD